MLSSFSQQESVYFYSLHEHPKVDWHNLTYLIFTCVCAGWCDGISDSHGLLA